MPERPIKAPEVNHIKAFNFQRFNQGREPPEALARSLPRRHKIKSKEEIGSSREKARRRASSSSIFIYFGGFYTMSRATMCNIMG